MELIITKENIHKYRTKATDFITKVLWRAGDLDKSVFAHLDRLVYLNISNCWLDTLETLTSCPLLTYLDCSANRLTDLRGIEYCKRLKTLKIQCNPLTDLSVIMQLPHLQTLNISSVRLTTIDCITTCRELENLDCSYNKLKTIEPVLVLKRLKILGCNSNKLTALPKLAGCSSLTYLDISSNRLAQLTGLEGCATLIDLNASRNPLTDITAFKYCPNIKSLRISCDISQATPLIFLRELVIFEHDLRYMGSNSWYTISRPLDTFLNHHNDKTCTALAEIPNKAYLQNCQSIIDLFASTSGEAPYDRTMDIVNECVVILKYPYLRADLHRIYLISFEHLMQTLLKRIEEHPYYEGIIASIRARIQEQTWNHADLNTTLDHLFDCVLSTACDYIDDITWVCVTKLD